ncbi:MAG: metallopeptidase TldD-related protein [Elusimicrobiota bacterium]
MKYLHDGAFGPPYFIAYRLISNLSFDVSASFGSINERRTRDSRTLYVEARYGDPHMDNTNLQYEGFSGIAVGNPQDLRADLWRLTDKAYKNALSGYLSKKALRLTRYDPENLDDFSIARATIAFDPQPPPDFNFQKAAQSDRDISAVFKRYPDIYDSDSWILLEWSRRRLLTSEGTKIAGPYESDPAQAMIWAMTRAPDGMKIEQETGWVAPTFSALPSLRKMKKAAGAIARNLELERNAPIQSPIAAPAILDPEFTGVLFHEALGHKLEGERQRDPHQNQIFKNLVGKKIIPKFLSVIDDPTIASFQGQVLHGFYRFDSEGVAANRVVLVDHGILRNFLMSRWPIKGFQNSNGHGRADRNSHPIGRMSNLIIESNQPISMKNLQKQFLKLLRKSGKPYGFLLVGAFGGENPTSINTAQTLAVRPQMIYRVDSKTGAKTLVRGVEMVGTPLDVLNRIVATGNDAELSNDYFCGAESGQISVSQIAPSVLVSEIELQRLPENRRKPPILPSPFHDE